MIVVRIELNSALALVHAMQAKSKDDAEYAEAKQASAGIPINTFWRGRAEAARVAEQRLALLAVQLCETAK